MSEFVSYDGRPEDLPKAIADTLSAIAEICGKSTRTLLRTRSLLKLFSEELRLDCNTKLHSKAHRGSDDEPHPQAGTRAYIEVRQGA